MFFFFEGGFFFVVGCGCRSFVYVFLRSWWGRWFLNSGIVGGFGVDVEWFILGCKFFLFFFWTEIFL